MRYFQLETDNAYFPFPQPIAWYELFKHDNLRQGCSHLVPKRQILKIENNDNMNYVDFITSPFLLVSDNVRSTMKLYDNNIIYKEIVLLDSVARRSEIYYIPILNELICLSEKSETNLDRSAISKMVLNKKMIEGHHVFRVKDAKGLFIIGSLDFVESLFRRNVVGLKLKNIELVRVKQMGFNDFLKGSDNSQFNDKGQTSSENSTSMSREELLAVDESLGKEFAKEREEGREKAVEDFLKDQEGKTDEELSMEESATANNFFPLEYLVSGGQLHCPFGSHKRRLNLPLCHGVYITGRPMIHKLDSLPGDEENISTFGVCSAAGYKEALKEAGIKAKKINLKRDSYHDAKSAATANTSIDDGEDVVQEGDATGEDLGNVRGLPCIPDIVSPWMSTHDKTKIVENCSDADIANRKDGKEITGEYLAFESATTDSFLVCNYGGIIQVDSSGQGYIDVISEGYKEAQEIAAKMAAAGVDTSKPVESGGEDSPYGTDGDTSTTDEISTTTPESDSESQPEEGTKKSTTEENGKTTIVEEPPNEPSRKPIHNIQIRNNWCYAAVAVLMAKQLGMITEAHQAGIANYEPLELQIDGVVWLNYSVASRCLGYDDESDYYYCDAAQEYAVLQENGDASNNDPGQLDNVFKNLTGNNVTFKSTGGTTMDDFADITVPFAFYTADANGIGHALLGTNISKNEDNEVISMTGYDPMNGETIPFLNFEDSYNTPTFKLGSGFVRGLYRV